MRPLRLVAAHGGPRARGVAIGRALKTEIAAHLDAWRGSIVPPGGGDVRDYVADLLRETDFKTAIRRHAPDLLQEIEGMAEGAGLAPDDIHALQLLDEEWAYRARRSAQRSPQKCSSLAIASSDGPTWIGQNIDLGAYTDGYQAMLRIGPDGDKPAALVFTTAGMIGLMGVNAAGVGVCVNALPQLPNAAEGLPVAFVLRRLLQMHGLDEASELVLSLPHATNQHYVIAAPGGVRSFEASAAGVVEHRPDDPSRVFHTNHPLTALASPEAPGAWENSEARLRSLTDRLAAGAPGLGEIEAALCARDDPSHPVCRSGGGRYGFTTGSMISELSPGRVASWASAGPPDAGGYHAFELSD
ncbi:MAG TPA: C45 family peptidase [Caulobacteraceae bacterium]|nr:C45 family peptidase [Caulobacteraceae bacterium]